MNSAKKVARAFLRKAFNMSLGEAYAFLGLSIGASEREVKAAYRALSRKHHPDLGGSLLMMKKLNHAKDIVAGSGTVGRGTSRRSPAAPKAPPVQSEQSLGAVLRGLKEGDVVWVLTKSMQRKGKKPRKVTVVQDFDGRRAYTTSGRVRPGHIKGGQITFYGKDVMFQATMLQQIDYVVTLSTGSGIR
jgi:hypothetical protein